VKFTALLLLLFPVAASAQYTYDYTSGPLFATSTNTPSLLLPPVGGEITGIITLSQELPQSGTVTVTPLTVDFSLGGGYGFAGIAGPPYASTYTFTTQDGKLTAFSFDQTDPIDSLQADSATNEVTFDVKSPFSPTLHMDGEGTAGSFYGGLLGAPEIDPSGAGSALTLMAGILALLRGRRIRRSASAAIG